MLFFPSTRYDALSRWCPLGIVGVLCVAAAGCVPRAGTGPTSGETQSSFARTVVRADDVAAQVGPPKPDNEMRAVECNDGIDNDGDGYVDAAFDPGCYSAMDPTEAARSRREEADFSTFEFGADSRVVYVSSQGSDEFDGSSPEKAVATLTRAADLVRMGHHDFMLLRRGDTFRNQHLGRFKSGLDAEHPMVIASYGHAPELPRIELTDWFIDHNGATVSNLALLDLHLVHVEKDPDDPSFTGAGRGGIRFVGNGENLLIEGCHFEYAELVVQSNKLGKYKNVSVRHNVVERSYHAETCAPGNPKGNVKFRPSGMFASHVEGLTIEGNLFDHNGWNEDEVETACATIYNHNVYLNANGLKLVNNIFARASSIHVKLRSDQSKDMVGIEIVDNFFIEGEIGISMGGQGTDPARFVDTKVVSNVFFDIGRSEPTGRGLAWGVDATDHENLLIEQNMFLRRQGRQGTNSYGLQLGGTHRSAVVKDNLFDGNYGRALSILADPGHEAVSISSNRFSAPGADAVFIRHVGDFSGYTYEGNEFLLSAEPRFLVGKNEMRAEEWKTHSRDDGARQLSASELKGPDRSFESYSESVGYGSSLEEFLRKATARSRMLWDERISARRINAHFRTSDAR